MSGWTLPDALQLLHQQYPGAFVTSGKRDPNSALGRANPRSYHNIGEAFDIRPMQGVDFNSYVSSLKNAGLPVVESLDEATNPKPWTTGPNWHVAFAGQKPQEDKKPMLTPEQRAAMFNVDIPGEQPQPFNLQKALAQISLPGMSDIQQSLDANSAKTPAQPDRKEPPLWAKILGVLGDSYSEVNGRDGTFIPALQKQRQLEDERNVSRDKLQAEIDARREETAARLQEPPQFVQNAQAWAGMSPEQQRQVLQQQDAVNPITVAMPDGPHLQPRTSTKVINNKTYYKIGDQWFEEGE